MCLLLVYVNPNPQPGGYYLILANVRDEVYHRPTRIASFWEKNPSVIGGMDLEPGKEGGTWLAMNKNGKIGALLNILQPDEDIKPNKKGRGFLAVNYAVGTQSSMSYLLDINKERNDYNGFLLVALDLRSLKDPRLTYFTNATDCPPTELAPGIHAFGNSSPMQPWPKVTKAKEKFTEVIQKCSTKENLVEELFDLLKDRSCYKLTDQMKMQGKSKTDYFMDKLSAIFVHIPESGYGSRCHTIITIDSFGAVDYFERSQSERVHTNSADEWLLKHHSFILGP